MTSFFKPKQTMLRIPQDLMIGELLVKAGVINSKQLDECIRQSGMKRLHLGQMLMMSGYITPRDLQAAVDAQTMMRENHIDVDTAVRCLKIACKQGYTFGEVIREQQMAEQHAEASAPFTLGNLLFEAELAMQSQLDSAYQRSSATNIPTGRILILNGVLTEALLPKALDLLVKVRDNLCSREEAVEAMRVAAGIAPESPGTQALLMPPTSRRPRLGQLMAMAGIMSENDVMNAVELGLTYNMQIGQVMVEQGYVSAHLVEAALELQNFIDDGQVDTERAGEVLQKVYHGGGTVADLITSLQPVLKMSGPGDEKSKLTFEKLLTLSRIVSQDQIHEAFDICRQTPEALAKILCLTGFIEGFHHDAVLRCHELLEQGRLSQDDALVALDYCFNRPPETRLEFDEALNELGWSDMGLQQSELAQLAHEQSFDPERTGEMPAHVPSVVPAAHSQGDAVPGFNLLEHFGLNQEEQAAKAAQDRKPAAPSGIVQDDAWVLPEDSGEGPSLSSMGVATSDTPIISFTDRILDDPVSEAAASGGGRLANILDRMADESDEETNGKTEETNGSGKAKPEPESPPKRGLGPMGGRVRPDQTALRLQEMTIAPQRLKIDDAGALTASSESAEPETGKKAAVGAAMYRLAESYFEQGDFSEAQKIYEKILAIRQTELGSQHVDLVDDLNKLAEVLWVQGNFRQAEPFVRRAVTILETTQPIDSLRLAEGLRILAGLFFQQGKFEPSLPFLEHALLLKKQELGEDHRDVGNLLREYAKLLKKMGRTQEAEKHYLQAKKILANNPA